MMVCHLGILVTETAGFGVFVGNGQVITSSGKCTDVTLNVQRTEIVEEFLLFDLGMTNVVLGYSWLITLGEMRVNWGTHRLRFKVQDQWIILLGDPALVRAQISFC